jgi:Transcription factor WhiB
MRNPRLPITTDRPRLHPAKRASLVRRIDVNWQDKALCRHFDGDQWFPAPGDPQAVAEVVEVCGRCPVQLSCLAAALVVGEEHGIWGGATEADRRYAYAALARGVSVPDVFDQLQTASHQDTEADADEEGREAA